MIAVTKTVSVILDHAGNTEIGKANVTGLSRYQEAWVAMKSTLT